MSMSVIVRDRGHGAARHAPLWARSLLAIAGSQFALMGAILAAAGAFAASDRSTFYVLAGFGLIASGVLLAWRHIAGVWAYLALVAAMVLRSLHDAGNGGSSLLYRLMGPLIMLSMVCALIPALRKWSRGRTPGICASLMIGTVAIGLIASSSEAAARSPPLPTPFPGVLQ
ncbi:hypothetical protein OVY29_22640 [Sphingopyxis sp. SE2]|uniref:hypothetical protein n=1 Tax=Sphingopyxis sp. SE2 TaxID=1586240 RepID=UPI0028C11490|nr:hypothetical protein [Sphingopyxis sp. SE2]MDT7531459.1 hypothetical protein [Sphingopyxis sp. SE2]